MQLPLPKILLLTLLFFPSLKAFTQSQPCNNYACKMELARKALKAGKYKSALDLARGAENYDASKKADVNAFIDQVFVAIEGKRVEAEEQRKKAELQRQKAEAAERQSEISRKIADQEQQKSEIARIEAFTQKEIAEKLLDSLGKFSGREEALLKFNFFKEKGDVLIKAQQWDSAFALLTLALKVADENPLIPVNKSEVYENLRLSNDFIAADKQKRIMLDKKIESVNELTEDIGIEGYGKRFEIYAQIDSSDYRDWGNLMDSLVYSIRKCLNNEKSNCCAQRDRLALEYLLLEIYEYRHDSINRNLLMQKLSNESLSRRRLILDAYEGTSIPIYYPQYYDKIMSKGNVLYKLFGRTGGRSPSVLMQIAYPFSYFSDSKMYRYSDGLSIRGGFNAFGSPYKSNKGWYFNSHIEMEYRLHKTISLSRGNYQYDNNGFSTTLFNVEKQYKSNHSRVGLIFVPKMTCNVGKLTSFTAGAGISVAFAQEYYSGGLSVFYTDTTVVIPGAIQTSFQALTDFPFRAFNYMVIGGNVEASLNRIISPGGNNKIYGPKLGIDFGVRINTDFNLFPTKDKALYKEMYDQYGVVVGRRMAVAEVFIRMRGPFTSAADNPVGPIYRGALRAPQLF